MDTESLKAMLRSPVPLVTLTGLLTACGLMATVNWLPGIMLEALRDTTGAPAVATPGDFGRFWLMALLLWALGITTTAAVVAKAGLLLYRLVWLLAEN